ncbi:MAG: PcfJ domain-containing protein [Candidatus Pacebacteria bacterium]|nr:PcfJ domain-containing protein [Candidatus Paceibacterota bacterium]MCF7862878.1 PcfJ domain-containing protein [Candidatus Paceibacterota bacterium]
MNKKTKLYAKKLETLGEKVDQLIKELEKNAKEVIEKLDKRKLRESLKHALQIKFDPKINELYGAFDTLLTAQDPILAENYKISDIYKKAKKITIENRKQNTILNYTNALVKKLNLEIHQEEIFQILKNNLSKDFDDQLKKFFKEKQIKYNEDINYNKNYLHSLYHKEPINLGIFKIDGKNMSFFSLTSQEHLQEESKKMGHCIGESEFYLKKIMSGQIMAISLRDEEGPHYTIEYDIKTKTIIQFKGGNDTPVNSLPNNRAIVTDTLNALYKMGFDIKKMTENFSYSLYKDIKENKFYTLDEENITNLILNENKKFIKGIVDLNQNTTEEQLEYLCSSGLDLNIDNLPKEKYYLLQKIEGSIVYTKIDHLLLPNLASVGGYINAEKAQSFKAPNLASVGGDINARNTQSFEAPNLASVGGYLFAGSTQSFKAPNLASVGGDLFARKAQSFEAPNLASVGGDLFAEKAQSFEAPNLASVGGSLYARNTQSFEAPNLASVGGDLFAEKAQSFKAPNLASVGGSLYAGSTQSFEAPNLASVGGSLYAGSTQSFEAPNLASVGGDLFAEKAQSFEAPNLASVGGSLYARNTQSFEAPNLASVGGSLFAGKAQSFEAPNLASVGGDLYAGKAQSFEAPNLTKIKILIVNLSILNNFNIPDNCSIEHINNQGEEIYYPSIKEIKQIIAQNNSKTKK